MSDVSLPGAEARLTLDASQFGRGIGQAQSYLLGLEPIVASQWWGLQNLGRAFGAIGGTVAAGLGMAVREAMAWESAMVGVQRTTWDSAKSADENAAALDVLEKQLRDVANTTPIAAHELAGLAESAGALGVQDVAEFSRIMGTLIATTDLTAASTEDLGRTLNVLGVPEESFERFASTLIEVGRNTAATETEILNMARRLAPLATAAGFTADEVLALGAAVISLGPRAEAGSSAITRMIGDISASVAEGGEAMEGWAKVAGLPGEKFAEAWRTDASATVEDIIVGLGKFEGDVVGLTSVLKGLDQANIRNVITLAALAGGVNDVGNEQTSLVAINKAAEEAWRENSAMTEVARQRYGTAAAQIQIMRNRIADAANTVGQALLPVLRFVVSIVSDLATGFSALPGPLQLFFGGLVALLGLISLFAGGVIALVGPLVLMVHTLNSLKTQLGGTAEASGVAKSALDVLTGGVKANTAALEQNSAANARNSAIVALGRNSAGQLVAQNRNAAGQLVATTAAAEGATVATSKLWTNMSRLGKVGAIVAGAIAIGTVALAIFGRQVNKNKDDTDDAVEANLALADAIDDQVRGISNAADEWILQEAVMSGMINKAEDLHVAMTDLIAIINGSADANFAKPIIDGLNEQAEAGNKDAKAMLEWLGTTHKVYRESASASGHLTTARKALAEQSGENIDAETGLADATEDGTDKTEKQAQATFDLVSAMIANRSAALDLKDAQSAYAKAVAEAADPAAKLAEAEWRLQKARWDADKSARKLAQAEADVLTARKRQRDELADAEDSLADSRDSYLDALDKIKDSEEALDKLRSGPTMQDLLEATNKLANAQLKLRDANRAVEDAEWQLAYLRGEGASDRAIQDAEFALEDARQDVSDATEDVGDAEEELQDLRDGASAEELASAERDLAGARRDADEALRNIQDREAAVQQLRTDIANDTAYKDAQAALVDANLDVRDSLREVIAAQVELQRIKAGGAADDLARAQIDLENAMIASAKASTEVQKQQAALQGDFWTTADEAHALADNIALMAANAPNAAAKKRLLDYVNILRGAKDAPGDRAAANKKGNAGGGNDLTKILPDPKKAAEDAGNGIRDTIESIFSTIAGSIIGKVIGGLIAAALGLTGGWAVLAAVVVGLIASFLIDKFLKSELGRKLIDGLIHGLTVAADAIGRFLHSLWFDYIWGPIKRLFGIESPSKEFAKLGGWLIEGLLNGLGNTVGRVLSWVLGLGGRILGAVGNFAGLLVSKGWDVISGLAGGIDNAWDSVWRFFANLGSKITGAIGDAGSWLFKTGQNLIIGLANGVASLIRHIPFIGDDIANTLIKSINNTLGIRSPSKVFEDIGYNVIRGFVKGIEGNTSMIDKAMQKASEAMSVPDALFFDDVMRQFQNNSAGGLGAMVADAQAQFGWNGSSIPVSSGETVQQGDHIEITGADERDAIDIAEEVMFKKLVRSNRG